MPTLYLIQEQQKSLIRTLLTGYLHFSIEEKSFTTQFFFIMIGQFQNESIFIQMWKKKINYYLYVSTNYNNLHTYMTNTERSTLNN